MDEEIKILKKKRELFDEVRNLKYYISPEVYNYLIKLISLDIPVLYDDEINEFLENFDIFNDIAIFNICNRCKKIIEKELDNSLNIENTDYVYIINEESLSLDLFSVYIGNKIYISICNEFNKKDKIKKLKQELELLEKISKETLVNNNYKKMILNNKLSFYQKKGNEIEMISNKLNELLSIELCIDKNEKEPIKKLSRIEIKTF